MLERVRLSEELLRDQSSWCHKKYKKVAPKLWAPEQQVQPEARRQGRDGAKKASWRQILKTEFQIVRALINDTWGLPGLGQMKGLCIPLVLQFSRKCVEKATEAWVAPSSLWFVNPYQLRTGYSWRWATRVKRQAGKFSDREGPWESGMRTAHIQRLPGLGAFSSKGVWGVKIERHTQKAEAQQRRAPAGPMPHRAGRKVEGDGSFHHSAQYELQ